MKRPERLVFLACAVTTMVIARSWWLRGLGLLLTVYWLAVIWRLERGAWRL